MNNSKSHNGSSATKMSTDQFSFSRSTEGKPLLFRLVEVQKWGKLLSLLNRRKGKKLCTERDSSGLTLVGICLVFRANIEIIQRIITIDPSQCTAKDTFGANPLHIACLNGCCPKSVRYLLDECNDLISDTDFDSRLPLHHIVECLCRDEIDFKEGTDIINMLCDENIYLIHASDKHNDTPLDIVHIARIRNNGPAETDRLLKIYKFLSKLSVRAYISKKMWWESTKGGDNLSFAGKSGATFSTQSSQSSTYSEPVKEKRMELSLVRKREISSGSQEMSISSGKFSLFGRNKR